MRVAGAWLLVAAAVACAEPEAPAPEWTWVGSDFYRVQGMKIEGAGEGRLVTIRSSGRDALIEMLDSEGATIWSRWLAAPEGSVELASVAVGHDGTVYVGGSFAETLSFDNDPTTLTQSCVGPVTWQCSAGFLAAYDQAGELRWIWDTAGAEAGGVAHVSTVPGGVVFVGGLQSRMTLEADEVVSPSMLGGSFVIHLDAAGNEVWRRRNLIPLDPAPDEEIWGDVYDMATDARGGIVLAGWYMVQSPLELRSVFTLTKLTADGQESWMRVAPAGLLALTEDGDIVVTAQFNIFGPPVGSYFLYAHRYDGATGAPTWSRYLGAWQGGQMYAEDIAIDPAGDVIIVGWLRGPGPVPIGQLTLELAGPNDVFVVRLRGEDGTPLAAATLGIPGADWGKSVAVLDRNDMVVAGGFSDEMLIDGESYIPPPDMFGVFMHRGDPFTSPPPFAP